MDIRIIEENKKKYLNMLTTKLFLNEEEVIGLSKGSNKVVIVICPLCSKQKVRRYMNILKAGHTLCRNCSKSIKRNAPLLGTRKGRLLIYDFAPYRKSGGRNFNMVKAICDCGVDGEYFANHVKNGNSQSCGCLSREMSKARVGELNQVWNPNLTDEERAGNRGGKITTWAKAVKTRDDFICQVCGSMEKLVAHHLNGYKNNPDARYDVENGVTMCRDCHADFHVNFMGRYRTPCTKQDFDDYVLQV